MANICLLETPTIKQPEKGPGIKPHLVEAKVCHGHEEETQQAYSSAADT